MKMRVQLHWGGIASRLRKAYVAARSNGVIEPEARARHSEAAAALRSSNRARIVDITTRSTGAINRFRRHRRARMRALPRLHRQCPHIAIYPT